MNSPRPLRNVALILLLIVLLPAVFYSVYELTTLSHSEQLMAEVYRQQLDVILFAMNQHASDIANSWAGDLVISLSEGGTARARDAGAVLRSFLDRHQILEEAFLADSNGVVMAVEGKRGVIASRKRVEDVLAHQHEAVARLARLMQVGYRKFESVPLRRADSSSQLMLYFTFMRGPARVVGGYLFDPDQFIRDVFAPRIIESFQGEFDVAIFRKDDVRPVSASSDVRISELKSRKELWHFPDHVIGIRKHGETVEDLVQARFTRNMVLILILDAVLIAGAWLVYRSLRREMELARLKSDFVSNVSHELRTPLALIRMYAETLALGRLPSAEKKKEYYDTIVSEAERLSGLVNTLLDFSRMEAGKKEYRFAPVDLNEVITEVLRVYAVHLRSEGFVPVTGLAADLPTIVADREAVKEALINLVDNAAKYSDAEKFLRVSTGVRDGRAWVEVEDHGIGIAAEHHAKIFETFYRVSTGLTQTTRGSGLGLALVRHIMDAHHGTIRVESAPGRGSRFRLVFPLAASAETVPPKERM